MAEALAFPGPDRPSHLVRNGLEMPSAGRQLSSFAFVTPANAPGLPRVSHRFYCTAGHKRVCLRHTRVSGPAIRPFSSTAAQGYRL